MNISKFKSRKEWSAAVWQKLLKDINNPSLSAALDSLLSAHEKQIIINRFAAVSLIKEGKTYRQIGEELWLSPITVRAVKKVLANNSLQEYESCRMAGKKRRANLMAKRGAEKIPETPFIINWIDYCLSVMPEKNGPRWKFLKCAK